MDTALDLAHFTPLEVCAQLVQGLPDACLLLNADLEIIAINDAAASTVNGPEARYMGRSLAGVIDVEASEASGLNGRRLVAMLHEVGRDGLCRELSVRTYRLVDHDHGQDGERLWRCRGSVAVSAQGKPWALLLRIDDFTAWRSARRSAQRRGEQGASAEAAAERPPLRDIAEHDVARLDEIDTQLHQLTQALLRSEERFRLAVESSSLGAWEVDVESGQVRWTKHASRIFGLDSEQASLAEVIERIHPEDRPKVEQAVRAALNGTTDGNYHEHFRTLWPDGSVRWVDGMGVVGFEVKGDARKPVRLSGIVWDVTEHQRLIESLRAAEQARDEFLAMLAHELKNPLAPLANAHRLLSRTAELTGASEAALAIAERQTRHLARLVDDLLQLSRVTQGMIELRLQPAAVGSIVDQAIEAVAPVLEQRGQRVQTRVSEPAAKITVDAARIAQALGNLLNNASKFSPDGSTIVAEVDVLPEEAIFRVIDCGVGLEPEDLDRIFELFTQTDTSLDRTKGGLGIGLVLVKRLVEMHGGSVKAQSAGLGLGSTFTIRLPIAREPAATTE